MAALSKTPAPGSDGDPYEPDEIFIDQLRDSFIFFTALTVAGMEAFILARKHYRERHSPEHMPHG